MFPAILRHPWIVTAIVVVLTAGFGAALPSLRVDNTPEVWLPTGLEELAQFREFREQFGDDSLILAFVSGISGEPDAGAWGEVVAAVRAIEGVAAVVPPPFVEDQTEISSPLRYHLASADGSHAAMALFAADGLNPSARGALVEQIEAVLDGWRDRVGEFRLAGADVITHDLDEGSAASLGGLSPLVFLAMCLVLYVTTREWRAVLVGLLAIVAVSVWTLGLMALAGRPINLVLAVVPAILAVIVIAQSMHVLSRFQGLAVDAERSSGRETRIAWWAEALERTWRPCLLCAVTTAAGFASLGVSEIPPIRDLGLFTAFGVVCALLLCFSLFPALLALSSRVMPKPRGAVWWTPERAVGLTDTLRRRRGGILLASAAVAGLAAWGIGQLALESHILTFFPSDHRVPANYRAVEEHLLGLTPFELVISGEREDMLALSTLEAYRAMLRSAIAEEPLLRQAVSLVLEPTDGGLEFVLAPEELPEVLDGAEIPDALSAFLRRDGERMMLRTTLLAQTASSNACHALAERLRDRFSVALPATVDASLTGSATLLIQGQVLLLETQVRSFAVALGVITLVIALAFRSVKLVLISLLPNLLPIAFVLGFMGLVGIPLNTATVTVAGIALGLIVDDTIHVLHQYGERRQRGSGVREALAATLQHVGRPAVITSLAVAAGFGLFAFAPFRPTAYFGLLIALTAICAIVCDLVVLPAVLQVRNPTHSNVRSIS